MKFFNIFKNQKYKCDEDHGYFQVLSAMETLRFTGLAIEVGSDKAALIRIFFVDYMIKSFIDWGLVVLEHLESKKELPDFSKDYLWSIIYEYRNRAIYDWERNWPGNIAMRLLINKVDDIRHNVVDIAYDKVMNIYNKRSIKDPDTKLDLILDSLKETFFYTFSGFDVVAKSLNGELSKELSKWKKMK